MKKPIVIKPKSHEEWLKAREEGIGASEVAALIGLSPWDSPFSLYLKKTHQVPPTEETEAMRRGHYLEDAVVQWWMHETGEQVIKASAADIIYVHPEYPFMRVTPDRIVKGRKKLLEVKTTSGYMGDTIPDYYIPQVIYQMYVTGIHEAELIYIQGDLTFGRFLVGYDEEFANFIAERVKEFWFDNIIGGKEPDLITVADYTIKGSEPGKSIEADSEAVEDIGRLREVNASIADLNAKQEDLKDKLKLYMGEAESLTFGGETLATWKSGKKGRIFLVKKQKDE